MNAVVLRPFLIQEGGIIFIGVDLKTISGYLLGVTNAVNVNSLTGVWGSFDVIRTDFSTVPLNELDLNVTRTFPETPGLIVF